MSERLQTVVVLSVVTVWAALTVTSFIVPSHAVPSTVDTIMGIVAGGAVANEVVKRAVRRQQNGNGNEDDDELWSHMPKSEPRTQPRSRKQR